MAKKGSKFNKYSNEFKLEVVQAYLSGTYGGMNKIVKQFNLKSKTQVHIWVKQYRENESIDTFDDKRNRGNNPNLGKYFREKKVDDLPLEEQLEYYKLENAVLKKVKALHLKK